MKVNHEKEYQEAKKLSNKRSLSLERPAKRLRSTIPESIKKKYDVSLTKMIAVDLLPYSFANNRGFNEFLNDTVPGYVPPHRTTISRTLMPDLHNKTKSKIINELRVDKLTGINYLSFTTDAWTSRAGDSYLSLTLHYLTTNFEIKNLTLGIKKFETCHTGGDIAVLLEEMLSEWDLADLGDIETYVVTDNARNMTRAVQKIGAHHITCFAHTLSLAPSDAKEDDLNKLLAKVITKKCI